MILHEDHSTPIVAVNTWYHVGSGDEKAGRTGFAHLFEHIMFMGSEHVPVGVFDKELEAAGGDNNGSTTEDRTELLRGSSLECTAAGALARLGQDGISTSDDGPAEGRSAAGCREERTPAKRRQRALRTIGGMILAALYPKGHPYSWSVIGSMADLSAASLDDVKNFFRTYYAPNNATLSIAGDFDPVKTSAGFSNISEQFHGTGNSSDGRTFRLLIVAKDTFLVLEDKVQLPRAFYNWPTVKLSRRMTRLSMFWQRSGERKKFPAVQEACLRHAGCAGRQSVAAVEQSSPAFSRSTSRPSPGKASPASTRSFRKSCSTDERTDHDRELARVQNSFKASFLNRIASVLSKADILNQYNYMAGTPDYVQQDAARYEA